MSAIDKSGGKEDQKAKLSREAMSLKRGREASLEPTASDITPPSTTSLPKKNRLEQDKPSVNGSSSSRTSPIPETEQEPEVESPDPTGTVGEVRRKVEKMSHMEKEAEGAEEVMTDTEIDPESSASGGVGETKKDKDLKRKALERSESSFADTEAKRLKDTPSPPTASKSTSADPVAQSTANPTAASEAPAPAPKKQQATFGAFSSSASPFATKPSSSTGAFGNASGSTPSTSAPKPFSSSGFGGFSGSASPFGSKKPSVFGSASASSSSPSAIKAQAVEKSGDDDEEDEGVKVDEEKKNKSGPNGGDGVGGPSNFGDILSGAGEEEETKDKLQMTEQDVVTGEEDESTMFQMRTKLYVMQSDNSWRERGVGVLRLNTKRGDGPHGASARLVMRAEGVLRLILNVSLYVGQSCLEDGKHVRTTVFEDGERRFVTFKTGSVKAAQELAGHIQQHIPLESSKSA